MAIIKAISSRATVSKIHDYLTQEEKTEYKLISGVNCNPDNMVNEFNATKELYNKNGGVQYQHIIQSFDPHDDITPEKAHKLGLELAEKQFKGYEVFVVTHKDKEHIHNHFVINSVNYETGLKYKASNKSLWDIKRESNRICEREHLKVLDLNHKAKERLTSAELRMELRGKETWKGELKECINFAKKRCSNMEEFRNCLKSDFKIDTRVTNKTISYKHPERSQSIRGGKLGADYDKEELLNEFIRKEKSINRGESSRGTERTTGDNGEVARDTKDIGKAIMFNQYRGNEVSSSRDDQFINSDKKEQRETGTINRTVESRQEVSRAEDSGIHTEVGQSNSRIATGNGRLERNQLQEPKEFDRNNTGRQADHKQLSDQVSRNIEPSQQHGESEDMERQSNSIHNTTRGDSRTDIDDSRSLLSDNLLDKIVSQFAEPLKKVEEKEKEKKRLAELEAKAKERLKAEHQKPRSRRRTRDFGIDR